MRSLHPDFSHLTMKIFGCFIKPLNFIALQNKVLQLDAEVSLPPKHLLVSVIVYVGEARLQIGYAHLFIVA